MEDKLKKLSDENETLRDLLIEVANLCGEIIMPTEKELSEMYNKIKAVLNK